MRKVYLTITLFIATFFTLPAQHLVSTELVFTWTPAQLLLQNVFGAQNNVSMYKVIYNTTDAQGEPIIASGGMFVPVLPGCELPVAIYNHGTVYLKTDVPSNNNGEATVGKYMGGFGFLGLLPDYLGLGESPGMHPYVHAGTQASATIDMIRAAQEFCEQENISLNGQLFLTGYSQGGHAAMATAWEIETNLSDEYTITASAPASGPYDISDTQALPISSDQPYASPEYLPYVIFSYQHVYGNLFDEPADFLVSPYDETLPPMFNGEFTGAEIAAAMPEVPSQIVRPDVLEEFLNDPNHPMKLALLDNDRYDWTPQHPMRLYYCTEDDQVFHENSLVTHATMIANGAEDVELFDMGELDHGGCVQPALFNILGWFLDLKEECMGVGIDEITAMPVEVFPNPATSQVQLRFEDAGVYAVQLRDLAGKVVLEQIISSQMGTLQTGHLARGMYVLTIDGMPGSHSRIVLN
jgi:pimeloyl-ACP methyl ester carboxylesterase